MPGRRILSEDDYIDPRYAPTRSHMVRRRDVLRETLNRFSSADPPDKYRLLAQANLARWRSSRETHPDSNRVYVVGGDWGEVRITTRRGGKKAYRSPTLTRAYARRPSVAYASTFPLPPGPAR